MFVHCWEGRSVRMIGPVRPRQNPGQYKTSRGACVAPIDLYGMPVVV